MKVEKPKNVPEFEYDRLRKMNKRELLFRALEVLEVINNLTDGNRHILTEYMIRIMDEDHLDCIDREQIKAEIQEHRTLLNLKDNLLNWSDTL